MSRRSKRSHNRPRHIQAICYDSQGKVISRARNNYEKSHPIQAHFASLVGQPERIYLHAEIAALLKAKDREVHTLVIKNLEDRPTPKPCRVCKKAIEAWGVKTVLVV